MGAAAEAVVEAEQIGQKDIMIVYDTLAVQFQGPMQPSKRGGKNTA
jgi:hypothetical protein